MLPLIPFPNGTHTLAEGFWTLPHPLGVSLDGFSAGCLEAFAQRASVLCYPDAGGALLLHREAGYVAEEYSLRVGPQQVHIHAGDKLGVIWALTSLYLLLQENRAPQCEILRDHPRYIHRGILLDCARHFFPVDEVLRVIEQMALAKMNVFHWHLSDDQGWRVESLVHPSLHQTDGQPYYTQQQIRELVAFAACRGVEVVPEIDLPGHTTAILAAYPHLSCSRKPMALARGGGIFPIVLCPGQEETFAFLDPLLQEIAALFPSPRFHIGGDEVPTTEWSACPDCRRRMEELGLQRPAQLQRYFIDRMAQRLRSLGKQPVLWNDSLRGGPVADDVTVQYWVDMESPSPMCAHLHSGGRAIFSGMLHCYFDYPHGAIPLKKVYGYRPGVERLDASELPNTLGIEGCLWTERVADAATLEQMLFPRSLALAEIAWAHRRDYQDFERRLLAQLPRLRTAGIACVPPELWNPQGRERRTQVLDGLSAMMNGADANSQTLENVITPRAMLKLARELFQPSDLLHLGQIRRALMPSKKDK